MRMPIQLPWEETKLGYSKNDRDKLWFGTEGRMKWFRTPNAGADTSPQGWSSGGVTINGDGYEFSSFGSHKVYQYSWKGSSSRRVAQEMKSYADGTYGRELLYFVDPTIYDLNVFPAKWADPSMSIGYEGNSLVAGVSPTSVPTVQNSNDLPVSSAEYNLTSVAAGFRGKMEAVYLPLPEGCTLLLGAIYSSTGTGGVYYSPVLNTGAIAGPQKLTPLSSSSAEVANTEVSDVRGVWLWVGKLTPGISSVTLTALTARIAKPSAATAPLREGPWIGGMGHSGCRFSGKPTFVENGPDWTGFSATFKEVVN